jgi:histone chaperone ASF1
MFITCSYLEQEFVRIGYYVNNEYQYSEPFEGTEPPPPPRPIDASKVSRSILAEKPRVTRYPIQWTSEAPAGEGDAGVSSICTS